MKRIGLRFRTIAGEARVFDLPVAGVSNLTAMALFGEVSRAISEEWHARDKEKAEKRKWLQKVSYEVIIRMAEQGFEKIFVQRIENFGGRAIEIRKDRIFQLGMRAIFADEKGILSVEKIDYYGPRLWYAFRHYVPPEFLIGLLHTLSADDLSSRLSADEVDPELESWIVLERAEDLRPEIRGHYPSRIEDLVCGVKSLLQVMGQHCASQE